jgi:hypothetical protein
VTRPVGETVTTGVLLLTHVVGRETVPPSESSSVAVSWVVTPTGMFVAVVEMRSDARGVATTVTVKVPTMPSP